MKDCVQAKENIFEWLENSVVGSELTLPLLQALIDYGNAPSEYKAVQLFPQRRNVL